MTEAFARAARLLPPQLKAATELLSEAERRTAEEIRLRCGYRPTVLLPAGERALEAPPVTQELLRDVLQAASDGSFHAVVEELRRGFVTARGGVRVGVCGSAAVDGNIRTLRAFSSLCIRIPRQVRDAGREILPLLGEGSVLLLSPPGGGKTTLLREIVHTWSDGGTRVALADERGEIAAALDGAPQFDVGRCTDVLSGAPKAEAALLLLRSMNPQVIALDEISAPEDAAAVLQLAGCGIRVLATAHAEDVSALRRRAVYRTLLKEHIFQQAVVISRAAARVYRVEPL